MDFLKDVIGAAADVESKQLYASIDESFECKFDEAVDLVLEQNADMVASAAADFVVAMGKDKIDQVMSLDDNGEFVKNTSLKESVDEVYQQEVSLIESASDLSIVAVYDMITESFDAAVERILKSDRKLRMVDKDGKPYKTRRRAAEAAVGASMRAAFGQKGMARKAAAGRKG